jgi:hypothetical protein
MGLDIQELVRKRSELCRIQIVAGLIEPAQ